MRLLPKRLLLLGTVACALGAAQPAAAQVQPVRKRSFVPRARNAA
jgi:hypothetical protein